MPIAHIYGLVHTSEGLGVLVERIAGEDGGLAPNLRRLASEERIDGKVLDALEEFARRCEAMHIVMHDFHPGNIVYTEHRTGGPECVCVDGFGEAALIPVHRWSRTLNSRRLNRKMQRLLGLIRQQARG